MMRHSFPFVCDTGTIRCGAPVPASWYPVWSQEKAGVPGKVHPTHLWQANKWDSLFGDFFFLRQAEQLEMNCLRCKYPHSLTHPPTRAYTHTESVLCTWMVWYFSTFTHKSAPVVTANRHTHTYLCARKHTHMQSLSKKNKSLQPDMLQDTGCDPDLHLHVECNEVQRVETAVSREDNPKHSL